MPLAFDTFAETNSIKRLEEGSKLTKGYMEILISEITLS